MVSNLLMFIILSVSGVLTGAIAWDDLFASKTLDKENKKDEKGREQTAE